MTVRKKILPPCQSCGDESSEVCWLCHQDLCDECLLRDNEAHQEEAMAHGGVSLRRVPETGYW